MSGKDKQQWRLTKYSANQPRIPAGQTGGGRWTSSSLRIEEIKDTHREIAASEIDREWVGTRKQVGVAAMRLLAGRPIALYDGDELVGAANLAHSTSPVRVQNWDGPWGMEVYWLATKRKGYGKQILEAVRQKAASEGETIWLSSYKDARPFYDAMGMKRVGPESSRYFYPKEGEKKKDKIEVLEPEEGVFAVKEDEWETEKGQLGWSLTKKEGNTT